MKVISLVLVLLIVISMLLVGCEGSSDSLPYIGPVDGDNGPGGGAVTNQPTDGGGTVTPPAPPTGGQTGGEQPPSPPVF